MPAPDTEFLTLAEICERWHVGRHVVNRLRDDGTLTETWLGSNTLRFRLEDVRDAERQLAEQQQQQAARNGTGELSEVAALAFADVDDAAAAVAADDRALWLQGEDWTVLAVSDPAARMIGYEPEDLVGRTGHHLQAPGQNWQALGPELRESGHQQGAVLIRRKDGGIVPVTYETTELVLDGRRLWLSLAKVLGLVAAAVTACKAAHAAGLHAESCEHLLTGML